jgi:hypothetical protein
LRRFGLIAIAAIATGLLAGVVIASSGDSNKATPSVPELKPPPGSISESGTTDQKGSTGATGATGTATTPTQTQTTPTQPTGGSASPPQDTQQNNVAPPKGSPASRFEQFCKDNPGAC